MPDKSARSVAQCLVQFMGRYGVIRRLHSDQGKEFKAEVMKYLCQLWRVAKTFTTPYAPWSDGQVERSNRTIKHLLKIYCQEQLDTWDEYTWCIMQAYNCTKQASTGHTPFILMHTRGENPDLPIDALYERERPDLKVERASYCAAEYVEQMKRSMQKIHAVVRGHLRASSEMQQRSQVQSGLLQRQFKIGDKVWWFYPPAANQKLKYPWTGPFEILDVGRCGSTCRIQGPGRDSWVHASALKLVHEFQGVTL